MIYLCFRRRQAKLTQEQLAKKSGVHVAIIGEIETGRTNPRPQELAKLARVLGVDPPERLRAHVSDPFNHDLPEPVDAAAAR